MNPTGHAVPLGSLGFAKKIPGQPVGTRPIGLTESNIRRTGAPAWRWAPAGSAGRAWISLSSYSPDRTNVRCVMEVPIEIIREAMADYCCRGRVRLLDERREALIYDGKVVGFVCPHPSKLGWRHGPMYVQPAYRGLGLVVAYYKAHPERDCVAFIADGNTASFRMHKKAGFVAWKRGPGGQWMRRPAQEG